MKSGYCDYQSFSGKTRICLCLLGIIPLLLVVYLFYYEKITVTETAILFSGLGLFCILAGFSLIRNSADKLGLLAQETALIGNGQKRDPITIKADREMLDIADNFNAVLLKLNQSNRAIREQSVQLMRYARDLSLSAERVKNEEKLRIRLSRYVGDNVTEILINSKDDLLIENERKEVTILFADIRSFSAISENMKAEEVVAMLNQFFETMVDIVFRHNGILDKFVGDQLMAVFGLISQKNSAPRDAVLAAVEMQDTLKKLMEIRRYKEQETFEVGIGINTGSAVVGNVGSTNRLDYTVIGDCVNVAARLEQIAKGGEIIIGERTHERAKGFFNIQERGEISVKNKREKIVCYEINR